LRARRRWTSSDEKEKAKLRRNRSPPRQRRGFEDMTPFEPTGESEERARPTAGPV